MNKKLITACLALAAFAAMALPALASASPVVTDGGVALAAPAKIIATNTGNTKFTTNLGTVECTDAVLTGTLTKNNGSEIEGDIETATFFNTETPGGAHIACSTAFLGNVTVTAENIAGGTPWCIKAKSTYAADTWRLFGGNCNEAARKIRFILHSTVAGECTYESAAIEPAVTGTFTTGTNTLKTERQGVFNKTGGGSLCPSSGEMDMTFDIYTDNVEETVIPIS